MAFPAAYRSLHSLLSHGSRRCCCRRGQNSEIKGKAPEIFNVLLFLFSFLHVFVHFGTHDIFLPGLRKVGELRQPGPFAPTPGVCQNDTRMPIFWHQKNTWRWDGGMEHFNEWKWRRWPRISGCRPFSLSFCTLCAFLCKYFGAPINP